MEQPLDLAASIRANTAAVQANTAMLARLVGEREAVDAPATFEIAFGLDVDAARTALRDAAETEKAPQVKSEVTLDDCKREATALAKRDRDMLAAILADMKAGKVSLLKPEQYADFIRRVDATIPF